MDSVSEYPGWIGVCLKPSEIQQKKDLTFRWPTDQRITWSMGFGIVGSGEFFTMDEVVIAEPGELNAGAVSWKASTSRGIATEGDDRRWTDSRGMMVQEY